MWSHIFRCYHRNFFFFQPCLMPQPFLFSLLDHCNNMWPSVHILKLVIRPFYFQSLSNFNYNTVKAFHILHLTFLKPCGHVILFPSASSFDICAILNLGMVVCYLIKIDLTFVCSEPIRIKLNLSDKF